MSTRIMIFIYSFNIYSVPYALSMFLDDGDMGHEM